MKETTVAIPVSVLSSVETLDEWQDRFTPQPPGNVAELRQARAEDSAVAAGRSVRLRSTRRGLIRVAA